MNYCCYTVSGKKVALLPPVSVQINVHEDAPADDMTVVFPLTEQVPKIATIRVWNGEKPIFSGIIDELMVGVTKSGAMIKLIARSRAALLLDNEAMPQEYHYPSLTQLYERHVEPYGFCGFIGNGGTFDTKLTITKGMSEWQVIEEFCIRCFGTIPYVTADDYIDCSGAVPNEQLVFDNSNASCIPYLSILYRDKFYKRVSELYVQPKLGQAYTSVVHDDQAHKLGVQRRRFVVSNNYRGTRMIDSAKRKAVEITVVCAGGICGSLKMPVVISDTILGTIDKLSIAGWTYTLSSNGERCEYLLRKEDI